MAARIPDHVVHLDPPLPVRIVAFWDRPEALLLRWEHSRDGWLDGWSAIVRYPKNGVEIVGSLNPDWLDDDRSERPFVFERQNVAPPPSHDPTTCAYCR